eukprot:4825921-Alexandrium_andersonii.AAC.1
MLAPKRGADMPSLANLSRTASPEVTPTGHASPKQASPKSGLPLPPHGPLLGDEQLLLVVDDFPLD